MIFLFNIHSFSQNSENEDRRIAFVVDSLLTDTNYIYNYWAKEKIYNLADSIRKYGFRKDKIFPFQDYEKVKLFKVNLQNRTELTGLDRETMTLKNFVEKKGKKFNKDQIKRLLNILNNPLAFLYGVLECQNLKACIVFYDEKENIIAGIDVYTNGYQIRTYPKDIRMKAGLLNNKDGREFVDLLSEFGLKLDN